MDSGNKFKFSFKKDDAIESVVKQFQQHFTELCIQESDSSDTESNDIVMVFKHTTKLKRQIQTNNQL